MAAVFPALIAVDAKLFAALRTNEVVYSFSLYLLKMSVPPRIATFVTTEPFSFLLGNLPYFSAAIFAACDSHRNLGSWSNITADVISATEGLHGIKRDVEFFGNFAVAFSGYTQFGDLDLLIIGHVPSTPSEQPNFSLCLVFLP